MNIQYKSPAETLVDGKLYVDGGQSSRGWHFHETMLKCPQLWSYAYRMKLQFPSTPPLARGSMLHVALAHYYRRLQAVQNGENPDAYHDPIEAVRVCAYLEDEKLGQVREDGKPVRTGCAFSEHIDLVTEAITAYMARYAHENIEVLAVETELQVQIPAKDGSGKTYLYTQRPDLIARIDGWPFLVDHKSRGRKDDRQSRGYCMSGQFQGYGLFGEQLWGESFGGRLLNYITWGRELAGGRKPPAFERIVPAKKPWAQQAFPDTIRFSEQLIETLSTQDPWSYPKMFVENGGCEHRYGPCPGQELCSVGPAALDQVE